MNSSTFHLLTASTELDETPNIPVKLWYEVYIWLDRIGPHIADQEKMFWDDDQILLVQMFRGELKYAFGGRPKSWVWIDEL